jgi:hypothetical protein
MVVGERQIRRQGRGAIMALVAFLLAGCGSGSSMTDAERVAKSDFQRTQVSQTEALNQLKQSGAEIAQKTYALGDGWAVKLAGRQLTNATFEQLAALGRVAELDLSRTNLTDAQLPELAKAAGVCFKLDLAQTAVTDAGLAALADLPLLMELNLKGTKVTPAAATQFQAARKNNPKVNDLAKKSLKVTI